jgi:hypothetical protein
MKKPKPKGTQKLPTKEIPTKLDMPFEDAIQLALNTPIKKSKVKK